MELIKRYLPSQIISTITSILGAIIVYQLTNSKIAGALGGTWGDNLGYYLTHLYLEYKNHKKERKNKYILKNFLYDIKHMFIEFGIAEVLDTFFIRPFILYIFPIIIGNYALGVTIGSFVADITFYIPVIISYELKKKYFTVE